MDVLDWKPSYPDGAGFKTGGASQEAAIMVEANGSFAKRQATRKLQEQEIINLIHEPKNKARFLSKIHYEPTSGCWLWSAAVGKTGHGQFFLKGNTSKGLVAAHRCSYMLHVGSLSPLMLVCHKCDNPYCVNPEHLFTGSHKDNMQDASRKGRTVTPSARGEDSPSALLTENDVIYIRSSKQSLSVLSERFGVSKTAMWDVKTGKTWSHLGGVVEAKRRGAPYTNDELALVRDTSVSAKDVAIKTGRTVAAVICKRNSLVEKLEERGEGTSGIRIHKWRVTA